LDISGFSSIEIDLGADRLNPLVGSLNDGMPVKNDDLEDNNQ